VAQEVAAAALVQSGVLEAAAHHGGRLRKAAFDERTSEADLVRRALRLYFDIE
jgi:hypothetical protein